MGPMIVASSYRADTSQFSVQLCTPRGRARARASSRPRAQPGAIAGCCLWRQLAKIEGPDRKKWLTGPLGNLTMIPMMCCATSGGKNWARKSSTADNGT